MLRNHPFVVLVPKPTPTPMVMSLMIGLLSFTCCPLCAEGQQPSPSFPWDDRSIPPLLPTISLPPGFCTSFSHSLPSFEKSFSPSSDSVDEEVSWVSQPMHCWAEEETRRQDYKALSNS